MRQFQEQGNVVQAGRGLLEAREAKMSWQEVEPLFACLVAVQRTDALSGPGEYRRTGP